MLGNLIEHYLTDLGEVRAKGTYGDNDGEFRVDIKIVKEMKQRPNQRLWAIGPDPKKAILDLKLDCVYNKSIENFMRSLYGEVKNAKKINRIRSDSNDG